MGAGWSRIVSTAPFTLGIAIIIKIPWVETNKQHDLKFSVRDSDGNLASVDGPTGRAPLEIQGKFGAGRPMEVKPGTDLDACVAFKIGPITLTPNDYVCELRINDKVEETVPFVGVQHLNPQVGP